MSITCFLRFLVLFCLLTSQASSQRDFIYTREGKPILPRTAMINSCLKGMNKDRSSSTAVDICECQISKIDRRYSSKQYRDFTRGTMIEVPAMIKGDSVVNALIRQCYASSGVTLLLQAEGFESEFVANCREMIFKSTEKKLDDDIVDRFCGCQLSMVKARKLTDAQMETLSNPNSLLFYEMMAKCGDPFAEKEAINNSWSENVANDIKGPLSDTITVLTLNGLTYVRMKTGSLVQFWLLDTGASDLLINKEMETTLKAEGLLGSNNYLGTGEYEMANGMIDTCRKYKMNQIQIGQYSLDNVVIAVTDKGKRIIAGKGMLNKFSNWILSNRENTLILSR